VTQRPRRVTPSSVPVSFDEYRLYYESAERVTDRRLAMNRWNYSIAVATLLAIGAVLTWSTSHDSFLVTSIIGVLMLSGSACLMCFLWVKQIDDFKSLNTAKFKILNEMAPRVRFEGAKGIASTRSYNTFEREWAEMMRIQALQAPSKRIPGVRGLRSSTTEYFIPRSFAAIFAAIFIAMIVFSAMSWHSVMQHPSPFGGTVKVGNP